MTNNILNEMINLFQDDVKRINHALKVLSFSQIIGNDLSLSEETKSILNYSAILHDIGIQEAERKHNSSGGKYQEIEGPPIAREILSKYNIPKNIIERVCFLVGNHHSYSKIDGIDFQILVEADFLVNIHEDEMNKKSILNVKERIFKTDIGIKLLEKMYL